VITEIDRPADRTGTKTIGTRGIDGIMPMIAPQIDRLLANGRWWPAAEEWFCVPIFDRRCPTSVQQVKGRVVHQDERVILTVTRDFMVYSAVANYLRRHGFLLLIDKTFSCSPSASGCADRSDQA
jgi:hypothetical protein